MHIKSALHDYDVEFFLTVKDLIADVGRIANPLMIVDRRVSELHLIPDNWTQALVLLDSCEANKSHEYVERLWDYFHKFGATKQTWVVAIGGGVVQDLAQFAAATYYRGLRLVLVPTTLLAQADSCIGGKCGINYCGFKNQLGIFHPPHRVLISPEYLSTLSPEEIESGMGEVVKLHLTLGDRLDQLEDRSRMDLVKQSLDIKRQVIEVDEFETSFRKILNYGHTFGHALESVVKFGISHGRAVAWGIQQANFVAWKLNLIPHSRFKLIEKYIGEHFTSIMRVPPKEIVKAMRNDKKADDGHVTLVLPTCANTLEFYRIAFDELERILCSAS